MALSLFLSSLSLWIPVINDWLRIYTSVDIACLLIITILYRKICSTVRRHRNQIQSLQVQRDEGLNREMTENVARLVKLAVVTFYDYLVFLACYLHNYTAYFVLLLDEDVSKFIAKPFDLLLEDETHRGIPQKYRIHFFCACIELLLRFFFFERKLRLHLCLGLFSPLQSVSQYEELNSQMGLIIEE